MDVFKLFPAILLDIFSKVIPGALFILVFRNKGYLPPELLLGDLFGFGASTPPEWQGWWPLAVTLSTAYVIGIFVAILAHLIDGLLVKHRWYPDATRHAEDFSFGTAQPPGLPDALKTAHAFAVYLEYCRSFLSVQNGPSAAMLEKYRTAFRFFVALTIILLACPLRPGQSNWVYLFVALSPVSAAIALYLSKRYMLKSIQYFMFAKTEIVEKK